MVFSIYRFYITDNNNAQMCSVDVDVFTIGLFHQLLCRKKLQWNCLFWYYNLQI